MAKKEGFLSKHFIKLILLEFSGLVLLFFIKYWNQDILIFQFNWQYTGNVLNIITSAAVLVSLLCVRLISPQSFYAFTKTFTRFMVIGVVSLVIGKLLLLFPIQIPVIYLFNQPVKKVLVGGFFCLYQVTQIYIFIYCWMIIFRNTGKLFFIASLYNLLLIVVGAMFVLYYLIAYKTIPIQKQDTKYSVGVVFGAAVWSNNRPSPILISRLQKAIELYQEKIIEKIQLTGSNAPGEKSEAEVARTYIDSNYALPKNDILIEQKTSSTTEQIKFIKNELIEKQSLENIAVISDSYHIPRINEIAKFYNLNIQTFGAEIKLSNQTGIIYHLRESFALILFWLFAL